ncbi:MAG: type IV pilus twitching motility protein PilT [Betaproteobacteria bacterium AqS2]|uniref:Type IV pilus twitching motility protein PilT n=1 Tax=Candidatus Amphirhobacter heronislandensis TaxID=1732024 RepID=A0A930UI19_9GAMM|nr:type IV pilus twitching motility protein PilT [Betaproteobacteria bacterium AqS2]
MAEGKELLDNLLRFIVENDASDLHISTGLEPRIRQHGEIVEIESGVITPEIAEGLGRALLPDDERWNEFMKTHEADFSYSIPDVARYRVNMFRQNRGIGIVFRVIPSEVLSLETLGAPQIFTDMVHSIKSGVVLVTGPTGSGKSTTLAAMINEINVNAKEHILTIEDPIEFVHAPQQSLINQREVGAHTHSFANALKAALREDPDVILVGEMRDLETIRLALTAAETGHLVFGTLHTSSAAKTMDRVIDVFPANEKDMVRAMLSESLRAVISQKLMKKMSGGRIACHEILISTPAIRNLIRENKVAQIYSALQTGKKDGMQTMDDALEKLCNEKVIFPEDAYANCVNKKKFAALAGISLQQAAAEQE